MKPLADLNVAKQPSCAGVSMKLDSFAVWYDSLMDCLREPNWKIERGKRRSSDRVQGLNFPSNQGDNAFKSNYDKVFGE